MDGAVCGDGWGYRLVGGRMTELVSGGALKTEDYSETFDKLLRDLYGVAGLIPMHFDVKTYSMGGVYYFCQIGKPKDINILISKLAHEAFGVFAARPPVGFLKKCISLELAALDLSGPKIAVITYPQFTQHDYNELVKEMGTPEGKANESI